MQAAGAADLFQLAPKPSHPVTDHPAVSLDLGFARTAQEAKAAALPFKVSP
jgi:hypothetical protein